MTKKQYIAFLRYKEGEDIRTPEDEKRWWSAAWSNPDITKNKEEGTILVNKGTTLKAIRERALSQTVTRTQGLQSAQQVEEAMASMSAIGASTNAFQADAFGNLGAAFAPGAAAGSQGQPSLPPQLWGNRPAPPAVESIIPIEDFSPFIPKDAAGRVLKVNRSEASSIGDEDNQAKRRRTAAKGKSKSGATLGPVQEAQASFQAQLKAWKARYVQGKTNLAKRVDSLKADNHTAPDTAQVTQEMVAAAAEYRVHLDSMDSLALRVKALTASGIPDLTSNFAQLHTDMATLASKISEMISQVVAARKAAQGNRLADLRTATFRRENDCKPYIQKSANTLTSLVRWLHTKGALEDIQAQEGNQQE